jgi:hypothetical protein
MGLVYRSLRITVSDANVWNYKTLFLDKKIGRILRIGAHQVATRNDFRVIIPGNTLAHQVSLYNGSESILNGMPIGQLYDGEDTINGISSRYLMELNGKEGILNTYGYLKAGIAFMDNALYPDMGVYGMKTENYLLFAPWYEIRDPSKPIDPVLNPIVFKYPYDMEFRFECEI